MQKGNLTAKSENEHGYKHGKVLWFWKLNHSLRTRKWKIRRRDQNNETVELASKTANWENERRLRCDKLCRSINKYSLRAEILDQGVWEANWRAEYIMEAKLRWVVVSWEGKEARGWDEVNDLEREETFDWRAGVVNDKWSYELVRSFGKIIKDKQIKWNNVSIVGLT